MHYPYDRERQTYSKSTDKNNFFAAKFRSFGEKRPILSGSMFQMDAI